MTRTICLIWMRLAALEYRRTLTAPWWNCDYNGRIATATEFLKLARQWRKLANGL